MQSIAEYCRDLFEYKEGQLIRRVSRSSSAPKGSVAGWYDKSSGYYSLGLDGNNYRIHQIIFLIHYNYIPEVIDHIDRDKLNNNISNLRSASPRLNRLNQDAVTGSPNISFRYNKYGVRVSHSSKELWLGSYNTYEAESILQMWFKLCDTMDFNTFKEQYCNVQIRGVSNLQEKFIRKQGHKYKIYKTINGIRKYYGSYNTLLEAVTVRDLLIDNNWDTTKLPCGWATAI